MKTAVTDQGELYGAEPAKEALLAFALNAARSPAPEDVLRYRTGRLVIRSNYAGRSIICKFRNCRTVVDRLRTWGGDNELLREWRALKRFRDVVGHTPEPLAYFDLRPTGSAYTDALVTEDLGCLPNGAQHVKNLCEAGQLNDLREVESQMVRISEKLVAQRMLDVDHRLSNFLVDLSGSLVRIDFEYCMCTRLSPELHASRYGIMLGTLIGSYALAVQPASEHARRLAEILRDRLQPSRRVLRRAAEEAEAMLNRQYRNKGIDTRLGLNW